MIVVFTGATKAGRPPQFRANGKKRKWNTKQKQILTLYGRSESSPVGW